MVQEHCFETRFRWREHSRSRFAEPNWRYSLIPFQTRDDWSDLASHELPGYANRLWSLRLAPLKDPAAEDEGATPKEE